MVKNLQLFYQSLKVRFVSLFIKNVIENKDNDDYVIDRFIVGKYVNCVHIYLCSYVLDLKNNRNFYHILVITDHRN